MRRRGVPPDAVRAFAERIGVTKKNTTIEIELFETTVRENLDETCARAMAVLRPIKVNLTNVASDSEEFVDCAWHPKKPEMGSRKVGFSNQIFIEQDDFMEHPPKGFHRLVPGGEVRLRHIGIIKCDEVVKNSDGQVTQLNCRLDHTSRPGLEGSKRKVKGTIHWVSASHSFEARVRLYDRLFSVPSPSDTDDWKSCLNPSSLELIDSVRVEQSLADSQAMSRFQFERVGYFCVDEQGAQPSAKVFNRVITLRDSWAKTQTPLGAQT